MTSFYQKYQLVCYPIIYKKAVSFWCPTPRHPKLTLTVTNFEHKLGFGLYRWVPKKYCYRQSPNHQQYTIGINVTNFQIIICKRNSASNNILGNSRIDRFRVGAYFFVYYLPTIDDDQPKTGDFPE